MSDLIDRQEAIDGLDGHYIERRNLNDWQAGWNAALDWMGSTYLDEFPSAQFDKDIDVPSNDTISRQAAIDAIDKALSRTFIEPCGEMILKDLPPVQPEPQWIPVSERLPEIGKYVLCYLKSRRYFGHYRVCIYRAADKYINHPYFDFNENGFPDVIAWMPLPEPYTK